METLLVICSGALPNWVQVVAILTLSALAVVLMVSIILMLWDVSKTERRERDQ